MNIVDWFSDAYSREAKHWVLATIPAEKQDTASKMVEVTLKPEQHYFRVWLAEMFLKDDRKLFREFVPVVHSAVRLSFANNPAQELPYVAGPQRIGLGENTLGAGVQLNHALTNLLPFRGGSVAVTAGLVAYQRKDFFKEFVGVLSDVSGIFNVGQLSSAIDVAEKVVSGVQSLLGARDKEVHLVYFENFAGKQTDGGSELKSGYRAIVAADASTFDMSKLCVKEKRLCYGADLTTARPLEGFDYMLLRIEAATSRDDSFSFPEFAKLLHESIKLGFSDQSKGEAMILSARVLAFESPDLSLADKMAVANALIAEYRKAIVGTTPTSPLVSSLGDVQRSLLEHVRLVNKGGWFNDALKSDPSLTSFLNVTKER